MEAKEKEPFSAAQLGFNMWQTGQIDGPVRIVHNISCLSRKADYLEYYIAMLIPGTKYNENQTQRGERLVYFQSFTAAPVFNTFQICRVFVKHRSIIHETAMQYAVKTWTLRIQRLESRGR